MGRRPDLSRRAEIASHAFQLVKSRGVHRLSMSELAEALGIKRPTLYWYFRDLTEIFDAVLDQIVEAQTAFMAERLMGLQHPIELLEGMMQADADFFEGRREDIIALFQLWGVAYQGEAEGILERGRAIIEPVRSMLVNLVAEGVEKGLVAPCDPNELVDLVMTVSDGIQVQRVTRNVDVRQVIRTFVDRVLRPLRLAPGERARTQPATDEGLSTSPPMEGDPRRTSRSEP